MTLDEALRELGVDRGATSEVARRAYLRLLKTRKPEVDPAGFVRLREAYERAKEDLAWREKMVSSAAAADEEVVRSSRRGETPPVAPILPTSAATASSTGGEPAPAQASHLPTRAAGDPPYASPPAGPPPAPPVATEEPLPTIASIEKLILERKLKTAAKQLGEIYDAASRRADVSPPSVFTTFDLLLRLHENDALKAADVLRLSFQRWLEASGEEARVLQNHSAAIWTIIRELAQLPDTLSSEVRRIIASAAAGGNVATARAPLISFRARNPHVAAGDAVLLRQRAPVLGAALSDALIPSPRELAPPGGGGSFGGGGSGRSGFKPYYVLPVILIGLLRIFAAANRSSSYSSSSYDPAAYSTYGSGSTGAGSTLGGDMMLAHTSALLLSVHALIDGNAAAQSAVREVEGALTAEDCASAQAGMPAVREAVNAPSVDASSELRTDLDDLERTLAKACAASDMDAESVTEMPTDARAPDASKETAARKIDASKTTVRALAAADAGKCGGSP